MAYLAQREAAAVLRRVLVEFNEDIMEAYRTGANAPIVRLGHLNDILRRWEVASRAAARS